MSSLSTAIVAFLIATATAQWVPDPFYTTSDPKVCDFSAIYVTITIPNFNDDNDNLLALMKNLTLNAIADSVSGEVKNITVYYDDAFGADPLYIYEDVCIFSDTDITTLQTAKISQYIENEWKKLYPDSSGITVAVSVSTFCCFVLNDSIV